MVWSGLEQRMQEASDGMGISDKSRWSWVFKRVITPSPLALGHEDLGVIRPTPSVPQLVLHSEKQRRIIIRAHNICTFLHFGEKIVA